MEREGKEEGQVEARVGTSSSCDGKGDGQVWRKRVNTLVWFSRSLQKCGYNS